MHFARLKAAVRTLRFRLTAWVALVVFLVVSATMLSVHGIVIRTIDTEFDQRLLLDMTDVRKAVKEHFLRDRKAFADNIYHLTSSHIHVDWFVEIFDMSGRLLWASPNAPKLAKPRLPVDSTPRDAGKYRMVETIYDKSTDHATFAAAEGTPIIIRLGSTRISMEDDIALLNWIMVLATISILILAPLSGYFLAGRATRPLNVIITTTSNLQPKKLDERLPMRGTGDELDQLSETINGMLDRIAAYIDSSRDFVANAAHELRSPLAAIRGSVDVALDRLRTPDEYSALLTDVAEECARLTNLLNRLLLLAEGDAGRLGASAQVTPLDKIAVESVNMFEAVADTKGVQLNLASTAAVAVRGEEYLLRQVVRNLIDNAIKFTPPGGRIVVDLGTDTATRQAVLRVSDTGAGILSEDLPRIFERFYRGDKSRSRERGTSGNGLGLAICQSIVDALGGSIQAQSKLDQGSTFTVRLPVA